MLSALGLNTLLLALVCIWWILFSDGYLWSGLELSKSIIRLILYGSKTCDPSVIQGNFDSKSRLQSSNGVEIMNSKGYDWGDMEST